MWRRKIMKIILSPAKKMRSREEEIPSRGLPLYLKDTEDILRWLREKSYEELKSLWKCNDKIAAQNVERLEHMDLKSRLTPAILSYEGLAFQYMAPSVLEERQLEYLQNHLRILSGFYGILHPMDGVTPYRLEMQAQAMIGENKNLYEFWGSKLYEALTEKNGDPATKEKAAGKVTEGEKIINLASKEYSKCIEPYLSDKDCFITVHFCENVKGKLVTRGTYAKMARGEMVRYLAEKEAENPQEIKGFCRLGFQFRKDVSSETEYVFERKTEV